MNTHPATHLHRPKSRRREVWRECVRAPEACPDTMAHGDLLHVEVCRCGAVRLTEANGSRQVSGEWTER